MSLADALKTPEQADILRAVRRYWGFDSLRPLQERAIAAGLNSCDSLVVMPTGGGKSLCYQVPPLIAERTDVVVSPLIALMKDQVDALVACGYPAIALHSNMTADEINAAEQALRDRQLRLVFAAPERLVTARFMQLLSGADVRAFAIDEAHCISHWGHDFRREYRQLSLLKNRFPGCSVHAFTATATERVREDIVTQLGLDEPTILVGRFDRPNLTYRVLPEVDLYAQVGDIVKRHRNEAVIIYCISRRETESLANWLRATRVRAAYYHAGMEAAERRATQDAFANEQIDVIVATVAFGMGVDRSDVRCVIHTAMPKSVEHYQQETGRAGRDGLPAECVLLFSPRDVARWERLLRMSAEEAEAPEEVFEAGQKLLGHMRTLSTDGRCRHRQISEYFGQAYEPDNCGACDVCLGEREDEEDATVTAQKILSCVARVDEHFGRGHVVDVLLGSRRRTIRSFGHDALTTHGLLRGWDRNIVMSLVDQLIGKGLLSQTDCDRPLLKLNDRSWEVLRGEREVRLVVPRQKAVTTGAQLAQSWEGIDRGLFEHLRGVRRAIAEQRGVPPFVIFGDRTLREMARLRPSSPEALLGVFGVGHRKQADLGQAFIDALVSYCREHGLPLNAAAKKTHTRGARAFERPPAH